MANVVRNAKDLKLLEIPASSRELDVYFDAKSWIERDYSALQATRPDIDKANFTVWGKSFSEELAKAKSIIQQNDEAIRKYEESKPVGESLELICKAVSFGETGAKWVADPEKYNATYSAMLEYYEYYTNDKEKAIAIDEKAYTFMQDEIEYCDKHFVEPFLVMKEQYDAEVEAENERLAALADDLGFSKGPFIGIVDFVRAIQDKEIKKRHAKRYMVLQSSDDWFEVQNLDRKYVYYTNDDDQIALLREHDGVYSEGSELPNVIFKFVRFEDFVTILGVEKELAVFKAIDEE
ncbi:hypothetical protein SAMN05216233_12469 [Desulfoluna spongiiphila]|uniref:Uncharacterized protein n=2 Tax=Desulfoluna spongiiphila TaxID=419481 RepID=A0A1G5J4E8_9BACT|nr:hypothetical protein SAMN05216233_12469 [Desulfoluna spongiiphila]